MQTGKVTFRVKFEKTSCEPNEEFNLNLSLKNEGFRSIRKIYIRNELDESFILPKSKKYRTMVEGNRLYLEYRSHIPSKNEKETQVPMRLPKRGIYSIHGSRLCVVDFFGFYTCYAHSDSHDRIIIYPKKTDKHFLEEMITMGFGDLNVNRGYLADESTIRSYGEYTGREPMRQISWKQSAKRDDFVVKQYEPMGTYIVTIVFDVVKLYALFAQEVEKTELAEYCVSMLRVMFECFESKKLAYRLYTNTSSPYLKNHTYVGIPTGLQSRTRMLEMLGTLDYRDYASKEHISGRDLLDQALKNSANAPLVYLAMRRNDTLTTEIKKKAKIKGLTIIPLYAEDYLKGIK